MGVGKQTGHRRCASPHGCRSLYEEQQVPPDLIVGESYNINAVGTAATASVTVKLGTYVNPEPLPCRNQHRFQVFTAQASRLGLLLLKGGIHEKTVNAIVKRRRKQRPV